MGHGGESTDIIDSQGLGGPIHSMGDGHITGAVGGGGDVGNRGDRQPPVGNGNAVFPANFINNRTKAAGFLQDFIFNFL